MPDKITIFRRPLERAFPDPKRLQEEIRITVLHELAHTCGWCHGDGSGVPYDPGHDSTCWR